VTQPASNFLADVGERADRFAGLWRRRPDPPRPRPRRDSRPACGGTRPGPAGARRGRRPVRPPPPTGRQPSAAGCPDGAEPPLDWTVSGSRRIPWI